MSGILALILVVSAAPAFGEEETGLSPASTTVVQENIDLNTQWVWGEVTAVDVPTKSITLKYLDYETDQEKDMSLVVDASTAYDNIKSLDEIKPKDNLSVDYIVQDGKNIAKNISLEKLENTEAASQTEVAAGQEKMPETAPQANQ